MLKTDIPGSQEKVQPSIVVDVTKVATHRHDGEIHPKGLGLILEGTIPLVAIHTGKKLILHGVAEVMRSRESGIG